jgi:peroxiredoxin
MSEVKRLPGHFATKAQRIFSLALILAWTVSTLAIPPAVVPRKSPEFAINEPGGTEMLLSSFKGKVVVMEFFFVRSPHCLQLVTMLNRLHAEFGPDSFQPIAIAFGTDANDAVLTNLIDHFKLNYPIGSTTSDKVDAFLGREGNDFLKIPQMVVIDRSGMIRAQSLPKGEKNLEDETYLRNLIDTLLKEPALPASQKKKPASQSPKN